jgi:hypothetical protein
VLIHTNFLLIFSHHVLEILKIFFLIIKKWFIIVDVSIILNFQLDLLIINNLIVEFERLDPIICDGLFLCYNNIFEIADDFLLDLQIDLKLNIL